MSQSLGVSTDKREKSALVTDIGRHAIFARSGEYWTIGYQGKSFSIRDTKGLAYIQRLLHHPGQEFHALDLLSDASAVASDASAIETTSSDLPVGMTFRSSVGGDTGELLDSQAKREYQRRLNDLKELAEDLRERGDHEKADSTQSEIEFLTREITRAAGLGGRTRRAGATSERARLNATRAIRSTIKKMADHDHVLAEYLDRSIRTGLFCSYVPDRAEPHEWQFSISTTSAPTATSLQTGPVFRPGDSTLTDTLASRTTFVGRNEELDTLRVSLLRMLGGEGSIVMIGGAAGVGKSRIAAEFAAEASRENVVAFSGGCYDSNDSAAFMPFVEILETALARAASPESFGRFLGEEAPEIARLIPSLRRQVPNIPQISRVSPEQARRLLFNAVAQVLTRQAIRNPVLLVLEDLQWADEGTLSLLNYLAKAVLSSRVLIVGTYRDNDLNPAGNLFKTLDELVRLRVVKRIALQPLAQGSVREMIADLGQRSPPESLVNLFYVNTGGNAFFVEELFRHLEEHGKLMRPDGSYRGISEFAQIDLPQSLRIVLGRRLARLTQGTQKMLATAAVIERSFTLELLAAASNEDSDRVLDCLEEAEKAGLLTSKIQKREARFVFAHELVRRALLDQTSPARQQRIHLSVANAIEHLYPNELEDYVEDLAHHLWHAGPAADSERTGKFLQTAAERAVQRSANVEAIGYFERALDLIATNPDTPERRQRELALQIALAAPVMAIRGFASPEVEKIYSQARALCEQLGEVPQLYPVLLGLWVFYAARAQHATALRLAEQCVRVAQNTADSALLLESHHSLGVTFCSLGEYAKGLEHLEQAIQIYDPAEHASLAVVYGQDSGVVCRSHGAWALWFLGYPERALEMNQKALEFAEKISHPYSLAAAHEMAAWIYQLCREPNASRRHAELALKVSRERDFAFWIATGTILHGWATALAEDGNVAHAIGQIESGLSAYNATGAEIMRPYYLTLLAEAHAKINQTQEGLAALAEAGALVEKSEERWFEPEIYRLQGELVLQEARTPGQIVNAYRRAERFFRNALAQAHQRGSKSLELRAAMSLFRLRAKLRNTVEARQILEGIYSGFSEGFGTADLVDAKRLLDLGS